MEEDKELGIIINHKIGHLCDGQNPESCIVHDRRKNVPEYWIKWWISFTSFPLTGSRAKPLGNCVVDDFNYFKDGITMKLLLVKRQDWKSLEVYYPSYLFFFNYFSFFS